jgi:hypothetical protein
MYKLKIARVTGAYGLENMTGPARQQYLLDQALSAMGHEIHVYTFGETLRTRKINKVLIREYRPELRFGNF